MVLPAWKIFWSSTCWATCFIQLSTFLDLRIFVTATRSLSSYDLPCEMVFDVHLYRVR